MQEIKRAIAATFEIPLAAVDANSSSQTIAKWDSIGHIDLVMTLQQDLGLSFTMEEIIQMKDFDSICRVVVAKTAK